MRRVLVTGANGFVGRELVGQLAESGISGIATGRQPPGSLPPGWAGRSRDTVLRTCGESGIQAVVHLEVKHHISTRTAAVGEQLMAVNVGGTRDWLAWAGRCGISTFIFASSIKAVRASATETFEDADAETADPYGRSKAIAEQAVRAWASEDPTRAAIILRFAPIYGPGNTANLAAFARQVVRNRRCFIGEGNTRKSVVSRRNAVDAVRWALREVRPGLEIFNVSDRLTLSIRELAVRIASSAGSAPPRGIPTPLAYLAAVAGDVSGALLRQPVVFNSQRLRALLEQTAFPSTKICARGFVHPQETDEGLADLVQWLKRVDAS